jgi:hypothetical protein
VAGGGQVRWPGWLILFTLFETSYIMNVGFIIFFLHKIVAPKPRSRRGEKSG